jgi:hypothetical protein
MKAFDPIEAQRGRRKRLRAENPSFRRSEWIRRSQRLSDAYIRHLLSTGKPGGHGSNTVYTAGLDIPDELVEFKRQNLKLKRKLKEIENEKHQ